VIKIKNHHYSEFTKAMIVPHRRDAADTRGCILEAAWDLFRELGARATIADIAERLGMSSANVYRFFPSKQALTEATCANVLSALTDEAIKAAEGPGPASRRIAALLTTLNRQMRAQMLGERRVHEIVDIALEEDWPPIEQFLMRLAGAIGGLVAEGQAKGEFGPGDPAVLGLLTLQCCAGAYHPTLIAHCPADDPLWSIDAIIGFALRALANPSPPPVAA
jgi:AcrR family transcriptional regulator